MLIETFPVGWVAFWLCLLLVIAICMFMYWWGGKRSRKKLRNYKQRKCLHNNWIYVDVNNIRICKDCGYVQDYFKNYSKTHRGKKESKKLKKKYGKK